MKTDINTIKDTFKIGYEVYEESYDNAQEVVDLLHNRHYTAGQKAILSDRGQPKETFNVIRMFTRMTIGYFSTVVNTIKTKPVQYEDIPRSAMATDIIQSVLRDNSWDRIKEHLEEDAVVPGLSCVYYNVEETGKQDRNGLPLYRITIEQVPYKQIIKDPLSTLEDYSDARFIHRWKWVSEEAVRSMFGKQKTEKLEAYYNDTEQPAADFDKSYTGQFVGKFKMHDNYLIIHSVIVDDKGDKWSIYWCGDTELSRKKLVYKYLNFPYRVFQTIKSDRAEFFGMFEDVKESQKAIDQALLQIQLLANTNKAIVEKNSVEDMETFKETFSRVNDIVEVKDLSGINIINLSGDVIVQYNIINNALDRIQKVLGINDSFLGTAQASDSGRKVKLQQNSTIVAMRYLTGLLEYMFGKIGEDILSLVRQYYTANQILRVSDERLGDRWLELNTQLDMPTGKLLPDGEIEFEPLFSEKVLEDGTIESSPVIDPDTDVGLMEMDIEVTTSAYNETDDMERMMLESMLQGPTGQALLNTNPAGYFKIAGLNVKALKARHSEEVAEIINQTAEMLGKAPTMDPRLVGQEQTGGENPIGQMMSAAGMTNDMQPDGYNQPK